MFNDIELMDMAERTADKVFEMVGEVKGEVGIKMVYKLFMLISLAGLKRLIVIEKEMRSCQKTK